MTVGLLPVDASGLDGVPAWRLFLPASGSAFFGLLGTIEIALNLDDPGAAEQAVGEGRKGAGVGEHLIPLREGLVGGPCSPRWGAIAGSGASRRR